MIALPNHCRVGKFSVYPANWDTSKADMSVSWRIVYWFYDDELKQKRQISIRGMNTLSSRKDRQAFVRAVIRDEMAELRNGFNPLRVEVLTDLDGISARTGLKDALNYALANVTAERNTVTDIRSSLKYIFVSIQRLRLDNLPVGNVAPKHIFAILNGGGNIKTYVDRKGVRKAKKWGPYQFNRSRTYLSLLFGFLQTSFIITADLYSLKHTYLDAIAAEAERIGLDGRIAAQKVAGHSNPVITMTYLTGEMEREHERKKNAGLGLISPTGN